jgi:hypothetical protein
LRLRKCPSVRIPKRRTISRRSKRAEASFDRSLRVSLGKAGALFATARLRTSLGGVDRELKCHEAAERESHDVDRGEREGWDQFADVAREQRHAVGPKWLLRATVSPKLGDDNAVALREDRDLALPVPCTGAQPMEEEQGCTLPAGFVVELHRSVTA